MLRLLALGMLAVAAAAGWVGAVLLGAGCLGGVVAGVEVGSVGEAAAVGLLPSANALALPSCLAPCRMRAASRSSSITRTRAYDQPVVEWRRGGWNVGLVLPTQPQHGHWGGKQHGA